MRSRQHIWGNCQADLFGSFQVNHELEFSRLFHGRSAGLSFFFNDTATTEIYTLSLHDALPIIVLSTLGLGNALLVAATLSFLGLGAQDRKSTRLNSSHPVISYAVFCLKKKKIKTKRKKKNTKQKKTEKK